MKHVSAASVAGVSGTLAARGRRDEDDDDKDDSDDDDEEQGREQSETHSVRSVTCCTRQEMLHVHLEFLYRTESTSSVDDVFQGREHGWHSGSGAVFLKEMNTQ